MKELSESTKLILKAKATQDAHEMMCYDNDCINFYMKSLRECFNIFLNDNKDRENNQIGSFSHKF